MLRHYKYVWHNSTDVGVHFPPDGTRFAITAETAVFSSTVMIQNTTYRMKAEACVDSPSFRLSVYLPNGTHRWRIELMGQALGGKLIAEVNGVCNHGGSSPRHRAKGTSSYPSHGTKRKERKSKQNSHGNTTGTIEWGTSTDLILSGRGTIARVPLVVECASYDTSIRTRVNIRQTTHYHMHTNRATHDCTHTIVINGTCTGLRTTPVRLPCRTETFQPPTMQSISQCC